MSKRNKSNKSIYYNKSRITKHYHYYNNVKIEINNDGPKNSLNKKLNLVSMILVLLIFALIWKFGILTFVKTNWETIEPIIEILDWIFLLVK